MATAIALPVQKQGLSEGEEIALWVVGGIALSTATFFIVRSQVRNTRKRKAERKASNEDSPESYAQKLIMAFENDGWWGTDEDKVYEVLSSIPDQRTYHKVEKAYELLKKKKATLDGDLKDELTSDEYQQALNIINSKPEREGQQGDYSLVANWTNRLIAAAAGWGTDEDAIYQVLREVPDVTGLNLLKQSFQAKAGRSLDDMLNDELSGDDLAKAQEIMDSKT